jgi:hypothetical protein
MEVKDEFVADTTRYSGPLRNAANDADKFSKANDRAALAARRMGLAAKEAADKASRAQKDAADAAEKLARGEIKVEDAAKVAARAENELERASIKAAEAQRAAANAADKAAANFKQMGRDATLAAAAEELAMLKASGKVKDHNALVLKLRRDMPELGKDGSNAFKLMTSFSRSFGTGLDSLTSGMKDMTGMWRAVPGLVIAGIELLPTAAAAAGGGITLALGGALAFIGLKAQASAADVKMAFSDMKQHVTSQIRQISAPFHDTLLHVSQDARNAFDTIAPSLKGAFANMAPALTRFSANFAASFSKLRPAIDSIGVSFSKVLDSLGSRMGPIMGNFATSIKAITDAVAQNPTAFTGFVEGISNITRYLGDGIGFLIRYSHQFNTLFQTLNAFAAGPVGLAVLGLAKIKSALGGSDSSFSKLTGSAADAGGAMTETGMSTNDLLTAQKAATMTTDQLKTALDALTGANQSAFDAQTQYKQALADAEAQGKKTNAGINDNTKAGRENRDMLSRLATTIKNDLGDKTPAQIQKMRDAFIHAAEGMNVSKKKAKELADQLIGVSGNMKKIPDKKNTDLTARDQATKTVDQVTNHFKTSFTGKIWKAQLTAQNKVAGAVSAAAGAAKRFAGALYRANLTALNKTGGVISGAASAARRFASGVYRASLTAVNNTWNALRDAFNAGNQWAGRVFTATFNVVKKLFSTGGVVGEGYAEGGAVRRYPTGGLVQGPGTETSDSIPIRVSNGEYVINAKQAAKHRELLDAINYGLDGYAKGGKVSIGKMEQKQIARLHAGQARVDLARARPEYLAAMAAQQALASMRSSVYGGIFRGGPSTPGSAHGTVVQHITEVHVTVQGSVSAAQDLAKMIQRQLLTNRMPVALPKGR